MFVFVWYRGVTDTDNCINNDCLQPLIYKSSLDKTEMFKLFFFFSNKFLSRSQNYYLNFIFSFIIIVNPQFYIPHIILYRIAYYWFSLKHRFKYMRMICITTRKKTTALHDWLYCLLCLFVQFLVLMQFSKILILFPPF